MCQDAEGGAAMDEEPVALTGSFATKQLSEAYDVLASDTSEIRLLVGTTPAAVWPTARLPRAGSRWP
jgi:hypothetical protein